jgi:hypothetical protein
MRVSPHGRAASDIISLHAIRRAGIMAEDMKTVANWAKELGIPEKKLKEAVKAASIQPDAKKGACSYYSRAAVEKAKKALK